MTNPICRARRTSGDPCKRYAVNGAGVCPSHGGLAPQVQRRALVRREISKWQLGATVDDPGETLLRMMTQSRQRAEVYASLLEESFDSTDPLTNIPAGVRALIGYRYALDNQGNAVPVEEVVRALVQLEMKEREFLASLAAKAVAAGLAERQVRVEEAQAAQVLSATLEAFNALGLSKAQQWEARSIIAARLRADGAAETIIR